MPTSQTCSARWTASPAVLAMATGRSPTPSNDYAHTGADAPGSNTRSDPDLDAAPAPFVAPGPFEREVRRRLASGRIDVPGFPRRGGAPAPAPDSMFGMGEPDFAMPERDPDPAVDPPRGLADLPPGRAPWPDLDEPNDARRAGRRLVHRVRVAHARTADAWRVPLQVAVSLAFARAVDAHPGLLAALRTGAPRVIVAVPDPITFTVLRGVWHTLLYGRDASLLPISPNLPWMLPDEAVALTLSVTEPAKPKERAAAEEAFLRALAFPAPIVCLATDAASLPEAAQRAEEYRLILPPFDAGLVAATVRIVTGRRLPAEAAAAGLAGIDCARLSLADLALAVRADRTPTACLAALRRVSAARDAAGAGSGVGRDLTLDQLHGLRAAVDWARGALLDLAAWRAGAPWGDVASGAVIAGPPGTGKTLLAQALAASGGIPLVSASLAQWQSADAAHLGTTLRAMRATFDEARAKARAHGGAILLIDEVDSFPARDSVRHEYRDYVIEVQNALLELLDGAVPREGVIVVGTTNAAACLDQALTRPGRLSRVIEVGYPDLDERAAMLRVRLGADLPEADLTPVARRTERATGAVIEELVAEARRRARRAGRALHLDDLLAAVGLDAAVQRPELLHRMAVHEAGHAVLAALELGTAGLVVALQERDGAGGWVETGRRPATAGTRAEIEALIRAVLAGHAAETTLLGGPSAGARHDLVQATQLAADLLGTWGLAGPGRLLALGRGPAVDILADPGLRAEAGRLLAAQHAAACRTIAARRGAVLAIAGRLSAERRLDGAAVAALIAASPPARASTAADEATGATADGDPSGNRSDAHGETEAGSARSPEVRS